MKSLKLLIILLIFIIQLNAISISCGSSNGDCYMDVENNFNQLDSDFMNLLSYSQKKSIEDILNNSNLNSHMKRIELNYYINKNVPQSVLSNYSKRLGNKISKQVEESLRKSGIYEPCFPFCGNNIFNKYRN